MHKQSDTPEGNPDRLRAEATWPQVERRRFPRTGQDVLEPVIIPSTAPPLPSLHFSTQDLPPEEQFEAWRAYMRPIIDVRLPDNILPEDGFFASHTVWHFGKMLFVRQQSDAYSYARTAAQLRYSPIDHWYLGLRRSGQAWTEVDGKVIKTGSGRVAFRTLGHPYRGRCTSSEIVLLYMPYSLFSGEAGLFKSVNNSILSGTLATLLANFLAQVETHLPSLTLDDLPGIVQTIRNMIVNGVEPCVRPDHDHPGQIGFGTMERVHHYIHHNLHDPQLTAEKICRSVGISRTRLYQLFESHGGVLNYIRKQRLQAAYETLQDPANQDRILDIAQTAGFDVAANFTRAFTNEFGVSPSKVRKNLSAPHPEPTDFPVPNSKQVSFENWLRNLDL
ncbi:AraC family transcriptional regulator [Pseudochrobactrum sp. XF203]|uniref:AraC family transcriptional regulator n=1 Tax=Pseudochrobactrum sp. XF203 TaxID=2879116 RepID=UPI001CE2B214|nr:AraC family transcriptional regulator [Pseudochrobactrum sp. XF203]UCA46044.1 AraC family transcriptional regulator [Pseudochrobactrum sp. XF203]